MKIKILKTGLILSVLLFSGLVKAQDKILSQQEIPAEIKNYVQKHFPQSKIITAKEDKDLLSLDYEIILDNKVQLDFNNKKQITSIEGVTELPNSVIPKEILTFVEKNYPGQSIVKWELEGNKQQVELDNDLELEFSSTGKFLRIDK